jgi:[protein-PII] uridylyltransferase
MSAPPPVLAADLALCHPKFGPDEVRAVARQIEGPSTVRLTIVARDRRGLLADTAGVLAAHGLSIAEASAATWAKQGIALHALTITGAVDLPPGAWERIGDDLRAVGMEGEKLRPVFAPSGRPIVTVDGTGSEQALVRVTANDEIGLLWAICRWFADHELSIESLHATTEEGLAHDVFLVTGRCDPPDLARHLTSDALTAS